MVVGRLGDPRAMVGLGRCASRAEGLPHGDLATANLRAAGFVVTPAPADSSKKQGEVVAQSPAGGGPAGKNTSVTINVSSGNRIVMPDLTGLTSAEVLPRLRANGYTGGPGNITATAVPVTNPAQNGLVAAQSVPPGTDIEPSAPLNVGFGTYAPASTTAGPPTATATTTPRPPGG